MTYKSYKIAIKTFKHYLDNVTYKKNFINWLTTLSYSDFTNLLSNNFIDFKTVATYKLDTDKSFEIFLEIVKKLLLKKFLYNTKLHLVTFHYLKHYNNRQDPEKADQLSFIKDYLNIKIKKTATHLNLIDDIKSNYYYLFQCKNNKFLTTILLNFQSLEKYIILNKYFYKTVSNIIYIQSKQYLYDLLIHTLLKQRNNINLPILSLQKYYLHYLYTASLPLTSDYLKKNNITIFFTHNYLLDY